MHLCAAAVVDNGVDSIGLDTDNLALAGKTLHASGEIGGGLLALKSQEVSTKTSDMGRSHRSSGEGVLKLLALITRLWLAV